MPRSRGLHLVRVVALGCAIVALGSAARAQPPAPPPTPPTAEQVMDRLRALEAPSGTLADQLERANKQHAEQLKKLNDRIDELSKRVTDDQETNGTGATAAGADTGGGTRGRPVPDYTEGHIQPFEPAPGYPNSNRPVAERFPLKASFGPGFLLRDADDRFHLQIHYESQVEGRAWGRDDQIPANSGLFLPRQRIFFDGHITKWVEYEFAVNRGLNNINLLNAYINLHLDDRVQFRFGRFFTPFSYDQYAVSNYWLMVPERSVFTTNLSPNRQIGAMVWGYLFDERLDYSAGVFNGSRNSFENLSNNQDFVGYVNARPFQESEALDALKFLNVGTSIAVGRQDQSPVPTTFRIAGGSPDANIPGVATVPFLILNPDVAERGGRVVGSVHAAYFYKGLSVTGEWQYGHGGYARGNRPSVRVPYSGFYLSAGYFLTGEHVERRTRVKPLRPLIPLKKDEACGPGAWEIAGRVSQLRLGEEVFTGGFADPTIWSNRATTTELGLNWYWNEYIKVYMFWLHGEFGSPVQFRPGATQKSADMFWLRFQLYF